MPLGTVVRDVYTRTSRRDMFEGVAELVTGPDWSAAGLYCYWDPENGEVLYIGLAKNLPSRFAQHNSLNGNRPSVGNKADKIDSWFQDNDRLGFSLVLQEGLADDIYGGYTKLGEGQLLKGFLAKNGRLPAWNAIGGSVSGRKYAGSDTVAWFDFMTGKLDSLVVARRTVRGLNEDPTADFYENHIHLARTALSGQSVDGKLDDARLLAGLEKIVERDRKYNGSLFTMDTLREYLSKPAPHPERSAT